jgi:hypothetical protein
MDAVALDEYLSTVLDNIQSRPTDSQHPISEVLSSIDVPAVWSGLMRLRSTDECFWESFILPVFASLQSLFSPHPFASTDLCTDVTDQITALQESTTSLDERLSLAWPLASHGHWLSESQFMAFTIASFSFVQTYVTATSTFPHPLLRNRRGQERREFPRIAIDQLPISPIGVTAVLCSCPSGHMTVSAHFPRILL